MKKEKNKEPKKDKLNKSEVLGNIEKVKLSSEKVRKREVRIKVLKMGLLISLLFLIIIYFLLRAFFLNGSFTISIDQTFSRQSGIVAYEHLDKKDHKIILEAPNIEFVDNISINWLPKDIDTQAEGSHNGENYIAYTFYLQNMGQHTINYWYEIPIESVSRNADNAIRIMVSLNGERTIYAKTAKNGEPEPAYYHVEDPELTTPFFSQTMVCVEERKDFNPGDIDRFTLVIWMEGDDPECLNDIIGGVVKMHMDITGEQIHKK